MSRRQIPRIARLLHAGHKDYGNGITVKLTDEAPERERDKIVFVRLVPEDLPGLRLLVDALEEQAEQEGAP